MHELSGSRRRGFTEAYPELTDQMDCGPRATFQATGTITAMLSPRRSSQERNGPAVAAAQIRQFSPLCRRIEASSISASRHAMHLSMHP